MKNENQKSQNQPEQQPSEQPTAPVKPVELTDEELGQVVGGIGSSTGGGGAGKISPNPIFNPDPTMVE